MSTTGPSGEDIPLEGIRMSRSETFWKKPNLPWGFCIYRCSFKDNAAWHKMLQLIQQHVQKSVELSLPPGEERTGLLEAHDLVIYDKLENFNGATSHEVRDRFNDWVEQLPKVVDTSETLERLIREHSERKNQTVRPQYGFGARFNFALFVDDICLESLVHMDMPVVKILYKQWGNLSPEERNYKIDPDWHDGTTEDEEEDVGWMYMSVIDYVDTYDLSKI
ncbi:uncharacterized protein N7479_010903 [Penicillium vulpinum]|uniref:Uncharacterized protein n=1 Tax=Penicillium vulpinum TaxID=29845 RepID=A0A1V6S084_9EURO|nr:uncharacterized protein N7479_010903 [Penicillium vulpinum]KAJ5952490.1 hypothetical protein N7479_010903 [Penicillium vulpinum]OQE07169.1 hypothetical protein PENVUL_c014G00800 [Penicillium vulpinum]